MARLGERVKMQEKLLTEAREREQLIVAKIEDIENFRLSVSQVVQNAVASQVVAILDNVRQTESRLESRLSTGLAQIEGRIAGISEELHNRPTMEMFNQVKREQERLNRRWSFIGKTVGGALLLGVLGLLINR